MSKIATTTAFNLMQMDEEQIISHLDDLINRQRFAEAAEDGARWLDIDVYNGNDPQLWFQLFLAASLAGKFERASSYKASAERCPTISDEMRGDLLRDQVNAVIRRYRPGHEPAGNQPGDLFRMLSVAWDLHQHTPAHHIADLIIWAKLHFYYGDYVRADKKCHEAEALSAGLGHPNPQWDRNLRFVWMRACAQLGYHAHMQALANAILSDDGEHAESRKRTAWLFLRLPWLAARRLHREENANRI